MWRPEALVETVSDMQAMRDIETLRHMDNVEARASVDTQANTPSEAKAEIMVKTPQDLKAQALVHTVVYKLQPRTKPVETNRENAYFFLSSRQKLKPPPNECPISPLPFSKVV